MKTRTKVIGGVIIGGVIVVLFYFLLVLLPPRALSPDFPQSEAPRPPVLNQPPPSTTATEGRLGAIDRILEKLEFGNIAFNAPKTMNLRDTAIIQLLLGLETPIDDLKQMIEAEGEKEGARIQVSNRMEARLSGPNFAITAITPETQAVSQSDITEWKWEVKPISAGRHYLHLTLSALLSVDGEPAPRVIRTFDKVIEVEVAWHQRVGSFFEKNWQWLWAAVLVPIVGLLLKRKKGSKPDVSQSDS